jgi:DNA-binding response OmpR family regulator
MASDTSARDIIIADNDSIIRGLLRSMLESRNFSVLQAVDGIEAIDYASRTKACLVILDYKMPKLDGFATCMEMRRLPAYADVPIVILTAFKDEDTREAAMHAGATLFLTKPFTAIGLIRAITGLLGLPLADGSSAGAAVEPVARVWKRLSEPAPVFGEPAALSEGRRVLGICRR